MKRFRFLGMTCLSASLFASACIGDDATDYSMDIAAMQRWLEAGNGEEPNGAELNGGRVNGGRVNGGRVNGETTNDMNIAAEGATLVGFVLQTGAVLRGANFYPAKLTAVLESGAEYEVRVTDWKQINVPGLGNIDYYMVRDAVTNQSICGLDENSQPTWAMPLSRNFNQHNGKPVSRVNQFSFNCYGGALEKCIRYGYPDWTNRDEWNTAGTAKKARSLDAYHDACVTMVRADYCGNGVAHTQNGTTIDLFDNLGFNTPDTTHGVGGWYFEAEWGVDGAWCLHHTRWMPIGLSKTVENNNSLANPDWAYVNANCPERIAGNPWPANPDGMGTPRDCDTASNYTKSVGYPLNSSDGRTVLRNHSKLYQR